MLLTLPEPAHECGLFSAVCVCVAGRDLDDTAQSLKGVESEKEELSNLTIMLQKSIEVLVAHPQMLRV